MKAIILAAGLGSRLKPLTDDKPKQMVTVSGRPILDYILELLPGEISEIILVIGYKGEIIKEYLGYKWRGKKVRYIEQETLSGPYAAMSLAKPYISKGEKFLVIFADDFYDKESIERLIKQDRGVLVHEVKNPSSFGIVMLDEAGNIKDIEEKPSQPKSNLAVTGAYVFDYHIFEYEPVAHSNGEYYLPPVIMKMIQDYPMRAERADAWIPIGYPEDIKAAEKFLESLR